MGLGIARAGDIFLFFLAKELSIDISYKNHSGFLSCFVLKFIELDKPAFVLKDFDIALGCRKAYIEPNFGELTTKKAIILKCTLKDISFLSLEEKFGDTEDLFAFFEGNLASLFHELSNILYDSMHVELVVYNDRVEFPFYEAYSKDMKLYASGSITETGDMDISIKMFFSPKIVKQFPEEIKVLLTEESRGWSSYYMHFESRSDKPFLKVESDRFRLKFEAVESH